MLNISTMNNQPLTEGALAALLKAIKATVTVADLAKITAPGGLVFQIFAGTPEQMLFRVWPCPFQRGGWHFNTQVYPAADQWEQATAGLVQLVKALIDSSVLSDTHLVQLVIRVGSVSVRKSFTLEALMDYLQDIILVCMFATN
jgi:hypothetical protein